MPRQLMWFRRDDGFTLSLDTAEGYQFHVPADWWDYLRDRTENRDGLLVPDRDKWSEGKVQHRFGIEVLNRAIRGGYVAVRSTEHDGEPDPLLVQQMKARGIDWWTTPLPGTEKATTVTVTMPPDDDLPEPHQKFPKLESPE